MAPEPRERASSLDSLKAALSPQGELNEHGAVALLASKPTWVKRSVAPLSAGGLRQSIVTLVQTSLGGGVLTLAFAMRLSGLGLGLVMLAVLAVVAFLGMDTMMRGAVKLQAFDTATLLAKCVGPWSGPAMDLLLVLYGNGALIAYFILLGDFLPALAEDAHHFNLIPRAHDPQAFRTKCIIATLVLVIPLSIPKKLSALRYATPVALLAVIFTACTVVFKARDLFQLHHDEPGFGEVSWAVLDWGFFQSFSILLFAFNCHLNVVPVASELTRPDDRRIEKITFRVVVVELVFYMFIAAGGYLSFLGKTDQNILSNYAGTAPSVTVCRLLLSFTILVGIPTNLLPTVRSLQGLVMACASKLRGARGLKAPLLDANGNGEADPSSAGASEALRLALTAFCLLVEVVVAINVPNVADVMGFLGASVGTILMMVLPAVVLFKAEPDFHPARWWLTVVMLVGSALTACMAIVVMVLQKTHRL